MTKNLIMKTQEDKERYYNAHIGCDTYDETDFPKRKNLIGMIGNSAVLQFDKESRDVNLSYDIHNPDCPLVLELTDLTDITDEDSVKVGYKVFLAFNDWAGFSMTDNAKYKN